MLWIVSGPSCVGKSTFLASPAASRVTGLSPATPTRFASDGAERLTEGDVFWHYNILRPVDSLRRRPGGPPSDAQRSVRSRIEGRLARSPSWRFADDEAWRSARSLPVPMRAVVLVAPRAVLLDRVRTRATIEPSVDASPRYPQDRWLGNYLAVDLESVYRAWLRELRGAHIPFLLLDASTSDYTVLSSPRSMRSLLRAGWDRSVASQ